MAPGRAYSFPLSHSEEFSRPPPFTIDPSDAAHLTSCEAFCSIRDLLDCQDNNLFCDSHNDIDNVQKEAWLLQRDITFALIFPLLEIYRKATAVALSMLGDRNIFDLELVFRGEARGAFSWLQCLTTVEHNWCAAEGCPACNVSYVLQSEPIIRLVITASHLASRSLSPHSSHPRENQTPPILDFWTHTLRQALNENRFWGRDSWKTLGDRARGLEDGIFAMAQQCCELEAIARDSNSPAIPQTTSSRSSTPKRHGPVHPRRNLPNNSDRSPTTHETWIQHIVLGCWTTLQADARHAKVQSSKSPQSPPVTAAMAAAAAATLAEPRPESSRACPGKGEEEEGPWQQQRPLSASV